MLGPLEGKMRRVLGAIFTGLAAFLLVLAVLTRFFLPGQVVKFPLNTYAVTTLTGTNVSYFSQQTGTEVTGATVQATSTTQGDVKAGSSSTAVYNNITGVFDVTTTRPPTTPISYSTNRLAFDRRTGVLVNCCGAEIGTQKENFSGQGVVWPIGTQKKTYEKYDTTLLKSVPVVYTSTTTVDGLSVYEFIENVDSQQFGTISLPGSLVGMPNQPSVTLPEYLTAHIVSYVDPGTGSPVKVVETQDISLVNPATGTTALTVFHGTLTSTPKSIAAAINTAKPDDTKILWLQELAPLIFLLVGVLLLVAGILMVVSSAREGYEYEYEEEEEVPAGA
jgi:hypothetical protein